MAKVYDQAAALSRNLGRVGVTLEDWAVPTLRGAGGRFVSSKSVMQDLVSVSRSGAMLEAEVDQIIAMLDAKVNKRNYATAADLNYTGKYFSIVWSTGAINSINEGRRAAMRMQLVESNELYISEKLRGAMGRSTLPYLANYLRAIAEEIMNEMIYDAGPVQTITYNAKSGGREETGSSWAGLMFPEYERTGALMDAVLQGITVNGNMIHFAIREDLAPYWLWVDRGHRVFLPLNGVVTEVGTWVVGRPFMEKIHEAMSDVMNAITGQTFGSYKNAVKRIGTWALFGSSQSATTLKGDYSVKNYPSTFGGYTSAFFKHVGVSI